MLLLSYIYIKNDLLTLLLDKIARFYYFYGGVILNPPPVGIVEFTGGFSGGCVGVF
jgi:hypothetical protein